MQIIKAYPGGYIYIGREGEHLARQVQFDISAWLGVYGEGTVELIYQRPGDDAPYPVAVVQDGDTVSWTIKAMDTARKSGCGVYGRAELRYYAGDALAKSEIYLISVGDAMDEPCEPPGEPGQSWVDQVLAAGVSAKESANAAKADANRAESAAIRQPRPDAATKTWWVWDAGASAYVDTGVSCGDAYLHPVEKTDTMTLSVGYDSEGKLFAEKDPDIDVLKQNLAMFEAILKEIQEKINSGTTIEPMTVSQINDMIVSYFENKTVAEVEA